MLLSVFDPALLIYNYEDWQARVRHCFERFEALTLHRRFAREYEQKIAMSLEFASLIIQSFPWNEDFNDISELRDLRLFILQELARTFYIGIQTGKNVTLNPTGVLCHYVNSTEVNDAWKNLLCSSIDETITDQFPPQIATWETTAVREHSGPVTITIYDSNTGELIQEYDLPVVWDDESWARQLVIQEWWPNLGRCVELHFKTNPSMKNYPGVRERPVPFECTPTFLRTADRFCQTQQLRRSLIEALTKRVYGILDASLGDEPLRGKRRFRVTDFWRVHYRLKDGRLVLEKFGPHDMDLVD